MLFQDDVNGNVNTTNSSIKENIDLWYQNTLLDVYDSYIEDTIYCNNRAISSFGGWNPNGGTTHSSFELRFGEYSVSSDLSCHNETDKFSVSNNSAKLIYKVGLLSIPELNLLHQSNSRISANNYWTVSPYRFNSYDFGYYINANGSISTTNIGNSYSVRPAISLISGLVYSSGTGTMADPYVIETN